MHFSFMVVLMFISLFAGEQSSMEPDTPASLGLVPASSSGTLATPTQPLFHYEDIVITQLSSLAQYIQTEGQVALLLGKGEGLHVYALGGNATCWNSYSI